MIWQRYTKAVIRHLKPFNNWHIFDKAVKTGFKFPSRPNGARKHKKVVADALGTVSAKHFKKGKELAFY